MNIIYLLIPLSLVLVIAALAAFFWAVRSGQFDDLYTPALKVLSDETPLAEQSKVATDTTAEQHSEEQV